MTRMARIKTSFALFLNFHIWFLMSFRSFITPLLIQRVFFSLILQNMASLLLLWSFSLVKSHRKYFPFFTNLVATSLYSLHTNTQLPGRLIHIDIPQVYLSLLVKYVSPFMGFLALAVLFNTKSLKLESKNFLELFYLFPTHIITTSMSWKI